MFRIRRALAIAAAFPVVLGAGAAAQVHAAGNAHARARAAVATPPVFFISGRGWGHGVGLSQYGAFGFAQRGVGYARILAHYYRGTTLGRAPVARVRVLLREGKKPATVSSAAPFTVRDGTGAVHNLPAGPQTFGPGLKLKAEGDQKAKALPPPLLFRPGTAPLQFGGPYRGQLQVNVTGGKLQVINVVPLEAYLYGVVPREMPSHWAPEALKAQAIVARSYALAVRKTGAFDLYPDVRSQVYGGIRAEKPTTNAAIDATAGQVLLYEGRVATTFFFSTSGGRTATPADAWGGSQTIPYLVSVPDPYDSISPHHTWGPLKFTAARLGRALKAPGQLLDVRTSLNPSQRVSTVTAVGARGRASVTGAQVRTALGLRSTWFRVGVISLDRPTEPVVFGAEARLTGIARGVPKVTLQQRVGSSWRPVTSVAAAPNGTISVAIKPTAVSYYRLAVGNETATAAVRVLVAPRVRLTPVADATLIAGTTRPAVVGAKVQVQRQVGTTWRTVATTRVDAAGAFEARLELTPGSYRARVAPARGLAAGTSPPLRVVAG